MCFHAIRFLETDRLVLIGLTRLMIEISDGWRGSGYILVPAS